MSTAKKPFHWTPLRRRFVEEYPVDCSPMHAAERAGFSKRRAKQTGYELIRMPEIADAIRERMEELGAKAEEATMRLSQWMRGNMRHFISGFDEKKQPIFDLSTDEAKAHMHLVKKFKFDKDTGVLTEIELYDAKDASVQVAKIHGLYHEDTEVVAKVLLVRDAAEVEPDE